MEINKETRGKEELIMETLPMSFVDKEIDEEEIIEQHSSKKKVSYEVTEKENNNEGSGEADDDVETPDDREEKARQPKAARGQNRCRFRVPAENRWPSYK